ncbi:VWA domain-containing protein [Cellulophaga sp. L1A9]|uniref:VWA domain-containing protein n=1 Tax=Cellulophaga sp. L1A9 TaxID=2686362 RepID=UPI00131E5948|nr:VWA domain-containing protein [Cellulophaga sp. L1A9]
MKPNQETLEKWRMILGSGEADGIGVSLDDQLSSIDVALTALYDFDKKQIFDYDEVKGKGSLGTSNPQVARWLGDIRKYFPQSVVKVLQNDAMKNPELKRKMMFEPEILAQAEADIHLVATLMELGKLIPDKTKETARGVVKKVVDELMQKLEQKTISSITGAIDRASINRRPRYKEINWNTTIRKNLKHYLPEYKTIIPVERIGYGRKSKRSMKDIVLCLDQSGSMGTSVVYSGIFGAVMASIPNVTTRMLVFDTQVADLTEDLTDPVDLLFGVQLGGGTDINLALQKVQSVISKPSETIVVLITDLYEGGNEKEMLRRAEELVASGVQVICLLALNDEGSPYYDTGNAKRFSEIGIPVFACTPDKFPDLMSAAIRKDDIIQWASKNNIVS